VRGTATALLLISRDRLSRNQTDDLIESSLAEYRGHPEEYKKNKVTWADVAEVGPLTNARHVDYYKKLTLTVEKLLEKMVRGKRQFNSLTELDNFLIFTLKAVR